MDKKDVIIMCAGKGTRLLPLTKDRHKCMVEVKGKPILHHILDNIRDSSINVGKIILIVGHKRETIKYPKYEFPIISIVQKEINGTSNAIYLCKNKIDTNTFLVLSGDIIYKPQEIDILADRPNSLLYTSMKKRLYEYGTIDFDAGSYRFIRYINEKSSRPTSHYVNCAGYHFNRDIFTYIKCTPIDERFNEKIITNTINYMVDDGMPFIGRIIDRLNEVTYPEDVEMVEKYI